MDNTVTMLLREGTPKDSHHFSELVHLSAPDFIPLLLGPRWDGLLQYLFKYRKNLFSYQNTYFIECDADIGGMVVAYDWPEKKAMSLATQILFLRYLKLGIFKVIANLIEVQNTLDSNEKEDTYISNIAVYNKYRNKGFGKQLINHVEVLARIRGNKRIVLDVDSTNQKACGFYKCLGYSQEKEIHVKLKNKDFLFIRMVKNL